MDKISRSGTDVGIGINNPTAKLHVNGTVAIGSSVYDSNGDLGTDGQLLTHVTELVFLDRCCWSH